MTNPATRRLPVRGGRAGLSATILLAVVAVTGLVAGCATPPPQAESMRDPQANFAAYRTFGWTSGATLDGTDAPLKLLDSNLRSAIAAELQRRGYAPAPDGTAPDLRMTYEVASEQKLESSPVRVGIGVGSWGGNTGGSVNVGSSGVRNYQEGSLVVRAIDTARNAEVWQGRVSKKITKGSTDPAAVAQAVAVAMQDFPRK
jgi:hypothetical protein